MLVYRNQLYRLYAELGINDSFLQLTIHSVNDFRMRLLLLTCFALLSVLATAQTPRPTRPAKPAATRSTTRAPKKPVKALPVAPPTVVYKDMLYKLDKSSLMVKIDELTETGVVYREPASPMIKQTLPRAQVWKVVFSDTSVEIITPLPEDGAAVTSATAATQTAPASATQVTQATSQTDYKASARARYRASQLFSRLNLTVGPEASIFSLGSKPQWTNDFSGLGMSQNIGASLRVDYRFIKAIALSVTGGYARWQLIRNYNQGGVEKYDETVQLTRIPVMAGLKIYAGNLYILPEGGINLLTETTTTSGAHPKPTNQQSNATPITYGGSLGYEFHLGTLLIDLSARYQLLDVKGLSVGATTPALTEKIQFGSLRVGLGFTAFKNK